MVERKCQRRHAGGRAWRQAGRDGDASTGLRRVAVALLTATWLATQASGDAQGFVAKEDKEAPKKRAAKETVVERPRPALEQVTLKDAVAIVRQAHGGRLVSAKSVSRPAPGYHIRIDVDGRVKSVFVDAQGRMSLQ